MSLSECMGCGRTVLELKGEYANLDSFYAQGDETLADTAGDWHALCLAQSAFAAAWYEARVSNFRDVRGYSALAELAGWTVLEHPRTGEVLAFGRDGRLLNLAVGSKSKARKVSGGAVLPVESAELYLQVDSNPSNRTLIASVQSALVDSKEFSLPALVDSLGIADRVMHPVALERGRLLFDRQLRRSWESDVVAARLDYGMYIPSELEPYLRQKG